MKITGIEARSYRCRSIHLSTPPGIRNRERLSVRRSSSSNPMTAFVVMRGAPRCPDVGLLGRCSSGMDPDEIHRVFEICQSVDFHHGRNWTVEVAVWDLVARAPGSRCGNSSGGDLPSGRYRGSYASTGERIEPAVAGRTLARLAAAGRRAAKLRFNDPDWREDVKVVEAAREAVGSGMEIMVDANQGWRMAGDLSRRWDLATAQECAGALGDLGVFWLEEPLDTADIEGYAALRESSPVRIAAGEMVRSLSETRRLVDVGRRDSKRCGAGRRGDRLACWWPAGPVNETGYGRLTPGRRDRPAGQPACRPGLFESGVHRGAIRPSGLDRGATGLHAPPAHRDRSRGQRHGSERPRTRSSNPTWKLWSVTGSA